MFVFKVCICLVNTGSSLLAVMAIEFSKHEGGLVLVAFLYLLGSFEIFI